MQSRMLVPLLALIPVPVPVLTLTQIPVLAPMTAWVLLLSIEAVMQRSTSSWAAFGHVARCCVWMRLGAECATFHPQSVGHGQDSPPLVLMMSLMMPTMPTLLMMMLMALARRLARDAR